MEKIRDSIRKELPPLRLYEDEVSELYQFISSLAEDVTLQAEGYSLNSLAELKKLPVDHIHNLQISSPRPYLKVDLRHLSAEIYIGSGDIEAEGIVSRLESILLKGRARVHFVPSGFWGGLLASIPIWIGMVLKNIVISGIGIAFAIAYVIILTIDTRFQLKRYTTILPMQRKEEESFWARNKDQLLLLIIGAIIGSVITMVVKWIGTLF